MLESVREIVASVPLAVVAEASGTAVAAVAGLRRLVPRLDGWYVVFALVACCLLAGWGTYGWDARSVVLAGWALILAYGGYNGVRRLIETGRAAVVAHVEGNSIPAPPLPPGVEVAPVSVAPPSEGPP